MTMATGALYPGTFDPFTNGHEELVMRAARIFGRVVVAVADSSRKQPLFSLDERIALIEGVLGDNPAVEVVGYKGLTVEVAREYKVNTIVRGLRAVSDFEYEFQLANMNRAIKQDFETVFLTPADDLTYISSTLVREIASLHGDVSKFVPSEIKAELEKKIK